MTILESKKQITGIEPASPAWEASILPMNYICINHIITYCCKMSMNFLYSHTVVGVKFKKM